jgi:hypothetical protein
MQANSRGGPAGGDPRWKQLARIEATAWEEWQGISQNSYPPPWVAPSKHSLSL